MSAAEAENLPFVVVDASVSLKWVLDDEDAVAEAVALRDAALEGKFQLVAPSLWIYELGNALVTAFKRKRIEAKIGLEVFEQLLALGVRIADPSPSEVYKHAVEYGLSAYDAAYLTLAQALGVPLWTGDRRLYRSTHNKLPLVHWIGNFSA